MEFDSAEDSERLIKFLGDRFEFLKEMGCNLLFIDKDLPAKLKKTLLPDELQSIQ